MFVKRCRILHTSRIRKRRHKDPSCVRAPSVGLVLVVPHCIALCSIVLYCIVLYCIVLYCIVLYCIVLYCIVLYCIVLYCTALYRHCWQKQNVTLFYYDVITKRRTGYVSCCIHYVAVYFYITIINMLVISFKLY